MKKSTKMVEEIAEKRKMSQEVKEKLNKRIFQNCLLAIGIMLYLCCLNAIYLYAPEKMIRIAFQVFPMIFIILTVGIFEFAYRKENGRVAIVGIEFLVVSIMILYIPQIYANLNKKFCLEWTFMPLFCSIYYIAKNIIIYLKTEKNYQNNLSDVKEIVKED